MLFLSLSVVFIFIPSPFLWFIVLSSLCSSLRYVCLSACLFFWLLVEGVASASSHAPERPSDSSFPRSRAQSPPGARRLHAQLQPWPVTPAGCESPSKQCQDTLFWVEGAVCAGNTRVLTAMENLEISGNFKGLENHWNFYFEFISISTARNDYLWVQIVWDH